jgi:hypothetical protein
MPASSEKTGGIALPRQIVDVSLDYLPAYGHIHLGCGRQVRANQVHVIQLHAAVVRLCVQVIQQRAPAVLIGKENRVAHPDRHLQVLGFVRAQQNQIAFERGIAGIYVAEHLCLGRIAQSFIAGDIELRAQLLSLVAVENTQRDADTDADRIYGKGIIGG